MKLKICLVLLLFVMAGCEVKWQKLVEAKVVSIKIVGAGGWGSPDSIRVWELDNGMTITMSGWKNEHIKVGDTVAKYQCVSGLCAGERRWQKVRHENVKGKL